MANSFNISKHTLTSDCRYRRLGDLCPCANGKQHTILLTEIHFLKKKSSEFDFCQKLRKNFEIFFPTEHAHDKIFSVYFSKLFDRRRKQNCTGCRTYYKPKM